MYIATFFLAFSLASGMSSDHGAQQLDCENLTRRFRFSSPCEFHWFRTSSERHVCPQGNKTLLERTAGGRQVLGARMRGQRQ